MNNAVIVLGGQRRDSAIHIHVSTLPQTYKKVEHGTAAPADTEKWLCRRLSGKGRYQLLFLSEWSWTHIFLTVLYLYSFFLGGSDGKESACSAGAPSLILGSARFPGEENGNPLQYSCLENPEKPGGLQSVGLQSVRHNWVTNATYS